MLDPKTNICLKTRLWATGMEPVILFPVLVLFFIIWFTYLMIQYEPTIEQTGTEYITATKTVTTTATNWIISYDTYMETATETETEIATATMSVNLSSQLSRYINATVNGTVNYLNSDISRSVEPLIEDSIQSWNTSWNNIWHYREYVYSTLSTLNDSIMTNLIVQSENINETIDTLDEQGYLLSIGSSTIDLSGLFLDYTSIKELLGNTLSEYSNYTNPSDIILPTISLENATFDDFYNSSLISSFLEEFKLNIGNNYTASSTAPTIFKREDNQDQTNEKPKRISIILCCIYPALVLVMFIIEWFSYRLERESISNYLAAFLNDDTGKDNVLAMQRNKRLLLFILCDSLKYPFSCKLNDWVSHLKSYFIKEHSSNKDSNNEKQPFHTGSWWIMQRLCPWLLFLFFILFTWFLVDSILPQPYAEYLSKRDYQYEKRQENTNSTILYLVDKFQTEFTESLDSKLDDYYTTTVISSVNSINEYMSNLTTTIPANMSSFLSWKNITEFNQIKLPDINITLFLESYLSSFTEASPAIDYVFQKRSTFETTDKINQVNLLFKKSIMVWASIFILLVVSSFLF